MSIETVVEKKPHLSPTQILMMQRCPAQWYYRYICGLVVPPSGAMTLGSSVDTGITHNYKQKIESEADLPTDDVLDAFSTDFEARKGETQWGKDEVAGDVKDDGARVIKVYQDEIAPIVQPVTVQEITRLEIPNFDYDLMIVPDVEQTGNIIRDTKVVGKSPPGVKSGNPQPQPHHFVQMTAYALATSERTQEPTAGGFIDYCVRTKEAKVIPVPVSFTEADYTYFKNMIALTARQIELEHYPPNRQNMMCSRRFCGYWEKCQGDFGGTVKE
ncbi:hypothetical protein LCGC14_0485890 [marine sediment metagenome]|uniref:PD-(D/E)XK endonuclease-like domain-containing protein n=1 Tax=marine sediment metagenome TaxID=412755 RepID=A0A0F9SRA2_9ZZZZ